MEKIDSRKDKLLILLVMYPIGILLGSLFYFLRFLNWVHPSSGIKILNWQRFPEKAKNVLVVANHPSLLEAILIPLLFFREFVFNPFGAPWSLPDKTNYFDHWYWGWARVRMIPVDRENPSKMRKAIRRIREILNVGGRVILHPEGGRTCSGNLFYNNDNGHKLRILKGGVNLIVSNETLILPLWIKGAENVLPNRKDKFYYCLPDFFRKCLTIKVGKPFHIKDKKDVTQEIALALLKLADEE